MIGSKAFPLVELAKIITSPCVKKPNTSFFRKSPKMCVFACLAKNTWTISLFNSVQKNWCVVTKMKKI